ncbi:GNAT family N-acetyltransferase [Citrobacter rodentium]|jgi:Acetyltransferases, including N-acetylases of ribosomal proteins|uniref:Acetyltransferase n=2 Tax=Citrobacter rodentium TaxID=67825 RepID=D2TH50_CITRI|nr:GNAT family N-acetyltransferase [Citrobacter rodentium]KIQ51690.1 GCN5 family acetyltransferase [Citrobacter rodentium]QBY29187.1 N-acetyltransferase [Citrobacter rodentium]UHO28959.1 GNAT family N-acetyltransferase [Citrobacter rodentium NBRC 105723 = DSM 16636]CBG89456.1 putative acetyltransferase [Citrobacter rodentium ICC168]HAT8012073.1 N-acetyltransferase [Citrobacter rodentium NBRC 105723 = DSM 16636]
MALLTTPRLTLSPFQATDWPFFLALRENPEIMRYMGEIGPERDTRLLFARRLGSQHMFVIRQHNDPTPLGDVGLQISHQFPQEADIGYCLLPQAQGRGFAVEAVRAVCEYAFRDAGIKAINAWVLAENLPSVRLLEKLGFVRTQILEQVFEINGIRFDDWGYRLESA